jgi:hypothetical protein
VTASDFQRRERLRFLDFAFRKEANGHCRAEVTLGLGALDRWVGVSEGLASDAGEMRCAAEATLRAIEKASGDAITFELLGVKAVRAFDTIVLIVSVALRESGESRRLVGSFLAEQDHTRGAALAILNATNRVMGNIFARDPR